MSAFILDGKQIAQSITEKLKEEIYNNQLKCKLAVILVGDDPSSKIYVSNKEKKAKEIGIESIIFEFSSNSTEQDISKKILELNNDKSISGILVQLPLPKHIDEYKIISLIEPKKDVDGICPLNIGKLCLGKEPYFYPCTPAGIMEIISSIKMELKGKNAVIIGRSNIVGKPVLHMLLREHCTVTLCHSRTNNIKLLTKNADILIVAIGKAKFVTKDMVKTGAVVIDVGINRLENGKLVGDVDFDNVKEISSYITPVPGGVGPMTIAMLMKNCVSAAKINYS